MKTLAEYADFDITLFGGEPLIAPLERLDALLALGYESVGQTNIQTNGVLVNDEHIALFHRYNTSVGISSDGPDEMNDVRSAGTLEQTREATARTETAIARLCSEGISTSIMVTLHRLNTGKALPRLKEWVKMLFLLGVESMRLHILEVDSPVVRRQYVLSEDLGTFTDLIDFEEASGRVMFDVATDLRLMLAGEDDEVTCVWAGCDLQHHRCLRCGTGRRLTELRSHEQGGQKTTASGGTWCCTTRRRSMGVVPDVRFFLMCRGQCPGTAINGDWRNRSSFCAVWKGYSRTSNCRCSPRATTPCLLPRTARNWKTSFWRR